MFGRTVVTIYKNGEYEMSRSFSSRNLGIRVAQTINRDSERGRKALVSF